MTTGQTTILWIYAAIIAIWPIRYVVLKFIFAQARPLTPDSPKPDLAEPPLISAIIPAKDEERTLDECLTSVRAQDYPRLEILVVDDRSDDRTLEIARRHEAADPRVRVIHNAEPPPPGWTGKTRVLDKHAGQTGGEWLWFLDADTRHEPPFLKVMMEHARANRAALVSILPELRCETFWERVVQPLGGVVLMQSFPLHKINDDSSKLAFANGQSILVERAAYDAAGGHKAVRDRFVEDIALARKVKGLGLPIRIAMTRGLVSCRMYSSLDQLVRGWSRILYDALDRRAPRLLARLLDPLIFCQSGHLALLVALILLAVGASGPFPVWLLGMSLVHHVLMFLVFRLIYDASTPRSPYYALFPLGNILTDYILIRSLQMCATGKVTWRGTSYGPGVKLAEDETPSVEASRA